MRKSLLAVGLAVSMAGCAVMAPAALPARGMMGGEAVERTVDSAAAADLLTGSPSVAGDDLPEAWADRPPNATELAEVSRRWSPDVAALLPWRELERRAENDDLVGRYRRALDEDIGAPDLLHGHMSLLVPGWLHRSDPSSGAEVALALAVTRPSDPRNPVR